jgi:glycosyltransferase involved in cell wall biosynthesis
MSTPPFLTVIVPTYNGSQHLRGALDSLLEQTEKDFEVLLVDDGSSDETLSIVAEYEASLSIEVLKREHLGSWTHNCNLALSLAKGTFSSVLHQDDYWYSERVARLKDTALEFSKAEVICHPVHFVSEQSKVLGSWNAPFAEPQRYLSHKEILNPLVIQNFMSVSGTAFRTTSARSIDGFSKNLWYTGDWDLWLRMAQFGNWVYLNETLGVFRIHGAAQTISRGRSLFGYSRQHGIVLRTFKKEIETVSDTPVETQQLAKLSAEVNLFLFAFFNQWKEWWPAFGRVLLRLLSMQPSQIKRYLHSSRLYERLVARVRAGFLSSGRVKSKPRRAPPGSLQKNLTSYACAIPIALSAAAFLSGPLRALSGMSLTLAFVLLTSLLLFPAKKLLLSALRKERIFSTSNLLGLILTFLFVYFLYSPPLGGLVSTGGGDAADHLYYRLKFVESDASMYHGFVSFFSFTYWLEFLFGLTAYQSFQAAFYFFACCLFFLLGQIAQKTLSKEKGSTPRSALYFTGLFLLTMYIPFDKILFPMISYLQADGFYPQLFGLLPLALAACFYSLSEVSLTRCIVLLAALLLYRYSYALNLAELSFTIFILLSMEAKGALKRVRFLLILMGAALAAYCLLLLYPLVHLGGATLATNQAGILLGSVLLGSLFIYLQRTAKNAPLQRLCLFAGVFSLSSALPVFLAQLFSIETQYYLYKYTYHSSALLILVAVPVITTALYRLLFLRPTWQMMRSNTPALLTCCVASLGLLSLKSGYEITRPHYEERKQSAPPFEILQPLAEHTAVSTIQTVLQTEGKAFGGFVTTPLWALSGFTNASFNYYHYNMPRLHQTGKLRDDPGHCIFWNSSTADMERLQALGTQTLVQYLYQLEQKHGSQSIEYSSTWNDEPRRLSYHCFE